MSNRNLVEHIKAINESSTCQLTTLPDHWADYNVYTPEELDRYLLEEDYANIHKDHYGVRPANIGLLTDSELKSGIDTMHDYSIAELEEEANEMMVEVMKNLLDQH